MYIHSQLEPELSVYLKREFERGVWTSNSKQITHSWVRDGLKARCITRDLKWGTAVPMSGYTDKVCLERVTLCDMDLCCLDSMLRVIVLY